MYGFKGTGVEGEKTPYGYGRKLYCRNCGKVVKRCSAFEMENAIQWMDLEQRCQCGAKLWFVRDI